MTIAKPKYCGQNWSDMKPVDGGRICAQCQKNIIDFSKMPWKEIIAIQQANNNSACGMYSEKQLQYWGQEIPKPKIEYGKALTLSSLFLSLAATVPLNSKAQTTGQEQVIIDSKKTDKKNITNFTDTIAKTIIRGIVKEEFINEPVFLANIVLFDKGKRFNNVGATTDINGYYEIDITDYIESLREPTLEFSCLGFESKKISLELSGNKKGKFDYNIEMKGSIISYYVVDKRKITYREWVKWKLKKWFGQNDK